MKKMKWGVIGCGGIADRRSIPGMMLSDEIELLAVMDSSLEAAERVKEKYGVAYAFDTVEELLALPEIEAVYIASPVFCHKEQAMAAADAGKHILLEKPICMTAKEGDELIAYCEKKGVRFGTGFMMRFHAWHEKIREIIASGAIGEVVSLRAQFSCWYPEIEGAWRQKKALSGGGAMMDMAVHCIDILRFVTGLEMKRVAGMVTNQIFSYEVEDAGGLLFEMQNGAVGFVQANFNLPDEAVDSRLEIYGTKGTIDAKGTLSQVEGGDVKILAVTGDAAYDASQNRALAAPLSVEVSFGNMYQKEFEAFGRAVREGAALPVPAEEAVTAQRIVEATYQSSKSGGYITL